MNSNDTWAPIIIQVVVGVIVGVSVGVPLAYWQIKAMRSLASPTLNPAHKRPALKQRLAKLIKRIWPDVVVVPLTLVWPVRSLLKDVTRPADDLRVVIMWVGLDVLLLAIICAFWVSLYVSRSFASAALRAQSGHKKD
jgi:hypothetical protein